jgi:hypothetical protein
MTFVCGILNGLVWESKRHSTFFIKWLWLAFVVLAIGTSYFFQQFRSALFNKSTPVVQLSELSRYMLANGRRVRIDAPLKVQTSFVVQDDAGEVFFTILQSGPETLVAKSRFPINDRVTTVQGILEPLPPDVKDALDSKVHYSFPLCLNLDRSPMHLWSSFAGLILCSTVLLGFLLASVGQNGFRRLPVTQDLLKSADQALQKVQKDKYWEVFWVNQSVGNISAAAIPGNDSLLIITSLKSEWEVGDFQFEAGESEYKLLVNYKDIREIEYGTLPVWFRRLPAIRIRRKRKLLLYSDKPETLVSMVVVVKALRENVGGNQSTGGSSSPSNPPKSSP